MSNNFRPSVSNKFRPSVSHRFNIHITPSLLQRINLVSSPSFFEWAAYVKTGIGLNK